MNGVKIDNDFGGRKILKESPCLESRVQWGRANEKWVACMRLIDYGFVSNIA